MGSYKDPSLKLFTLIKFDDYDWMKLSPLAIMETVITEANAKNEILSAAADASSTTASSGETCARKLILATHKKIEAGEATKIKLEGSAYTSFSRLSTLFGSMEDLNPEAVKGLLSVFATKLDSQEITTTPREEASELEETLAQMITLERLLAKRRADSHERSGG